jgi:hypothetical protein
MRRQVIAENCSFDAFYGLCFLFCFLLFVVIRRLVGLLRIGFGFPWLWDLFSGQPILSVQSYLFCVFWLRSRRVFQRIFCTIRSYSIRHGTTELSASMWL